MTWKAFVRATRPSFYVLVQKYNVLVKMLNWPVVPHMRNSIAQGLSGAILQLQPLPWDDSKLKRGFINRLLWCDRAVQVVPFRARVGLLLAMRFGFSIYDLPTHWPAVASCGGRSNRHYISHLCSPLISQKPIELRLTERSRIIELVQLGAFATWSGFEKKRVRTTPILNPNPDRPDVFMGMKIRRGTFATWSSFEKKRVRTTPILNPNPDRPDVFMGMKRR